MGNDTPPTGTAIPRPFRKAEPPPPSEPPVTVSFPPPPLNPTVADIYALIDSRLSPKILERISSAPPAATPKHSMPVQAAKWTGKVYAYVVAIGISIVQIIATAALPEYRGPIVQAAKLSMLIVAEVFKDDPTALPSADTPEMLPEPVSPLLPPE